MNATASGIWRKNAALAWREIDNETVIISPGESVMHELNDTGSLIWRSIDGQRNAEELAALLVDEYDVTKEVALTDTLALLEELSSRKLLVPGEAAQRSESR